MSSTTDEHLVVESAWAALLAMAHAEAPAAHVPGDLGALFLPLLEVPASRPMVVVHLASSLDGCIASEHGQSQWISGDEDLLHTHRLRSFVDAVVVGSRTVETDDPRLNPRRCTGPDPLRVVIDPSARLTGPLQVLQDGAATLVISAQPGQDDGTMERVVLPATEGLIDPNRLLAELASRGIRRVMVEGGGVTASRFLRAGCVDRLHLTLAPMLIGGGRPVLPEPLAEHLADCPRPRTRMFRLGADWLMDCDLRTSA